MWKLAAETGCRILPLCVTAALSLPMFFTAFTENILTVMLKFMRTEPARMIRGTGVRADFALMPMVLLKINLLCRAIFLAATMIRHRAVKEHRTRKEPAAAATYWDAGHILSRTILT